MWLWVFVFGGIALAGLVMLICYAVWLAHKTADVMSELTVLGERSGKILDLLGQIQMPQAAGQVIEEDGFASPGRFDPARTVDDRAEVFVPWQNRARDVR